MQTNISLAQMIAFFQILIPLSAAARIIFCISDIAISGDQDGSMKSRIRNILIFVVLAETVTGIVSLAQSYF